MGEIDKLWRGWPLFINAFSWNWLSFIIASHTPRVHTYGGLLDFCKCLTMSEILSETYLAHLHRSYLGDVKQSNMPNCLCVLDYSHDNEESL